MVSFDATLPKEEILKLIYDDWKEKKDFKSMTKTQLIDHIKKVTPWLECPAQKGEKAMPQNCMFCMSGHLTECHWPLSCSEAVCNHYQQDPDSDVWNGDPGSS